MFQFGLLNILVLINIAIAIMLYISGRKMLLENLQNRYLIFLYNDHTSPCETLFKKKVWTQFTAIGTHTTYGNSGLQDPEQDWSVLFTCHV